VKPSLQIALSTDIVARKDIQPAHPAQHHAFRGPSTDASDAGAVGDSLVVRQLIEIRQVGVVRHDVLRQVCYRGGLLPAGSEFLAALFGHVDQVGWLPKRVLGDAVVDKSGAERE
jgi:hypothetical protein